MSAQTPALSEVHHPLGDPAGPGLFHVKGLQLPAYIQNIAHSLMRDGHPESRAIELAIGAVQRWAGGGGNVHPEVRAASVKALAEWEKAKAEAHAKPNQSEHAGDTAAVELSNDQPRVPSGNDGAGRFYTDTTEVRTAPVPKVTAKNLPKLQEALETLRKTGKVELANGEAREILLAAVAGHHVAGTHPGNRQTSFLKSSRDNKMVPALPDGQAGGGLPETVQIGWSAQDALQSLRPEDTAGAQPGVPADRASGQEPATGTRGHEVVHQLPPAEALRRLLAGDAGQAWAGRALQAVRKAQQSRENAGTAGQRPGAVPARRLEPAPGPAVRGDVRLGRGADRGDRLPVSDVRGPVQHGHAVVPGSAVRGSLPRRGEGDRRDEGARRDLSQVQLSAGIGEGQAADVAESGRVSGVVELAAVAGHHVKNTAYHWRHGWHPLDVATALLWKKHDAAKKLHKAGAAHFNAEPQSWWAKNPHLKQTLHAGEVGHGKHEPTLYKAVPDAAALAKITKKSHYVVNGKNGVHITAQEPKGPHVVLEPGGYAGKVGKVKPEAPKLTPVAANAPKAPEAPKAPTKPTLAQPPAGLKGEAAKATGQQSDLQHMNEKALNDLSAYLVQKAVALHNEGKVAGDPQFDAVTKELGKINDAIGYAKNGPKPTGNLTEDLKGALQHKLIQAKSLDAPGGKAVNPESLIDSPQAAHAFMKNLHMVKEDKYLNSAMDTLGFAATNSSSKPDYASLTSHAHANLSASERAKHAAAVNAVAGVLDHYGVGDKQGQFFVHKGTDDGHLSKKGVPVSDYLKGYSAALTAKPEKAHEPTPPKPATVSTVSGEKIYHPAAASGTNPAGYATKKAANNNAAKLAEQTGQTHWAYEKPTGQGGVKHVVTSQEPGTPLKTKWEPKAGAKSEPKVTPAVTEPKAQLPTVVPHLDEINANANQKLVEAAKNAEPQAGHVGMAGAAAALQKAVLTGQTQHTDIKGKTLGPSELSADPTHISYHPNGAVLAHGMKVQSAPDVFLKALSNHLSPKSGAGTHEVHNNPKLPGEKATPKAEPIPSKPVEAVTGEPKVTPAAAEPKATPTAAEPKAQADRFTPVDTSGWTKTSGPKGSNPGGIYKDPGGGEYYVKKSKTADHARNEVLAAELYKLTGTDTADLRLAKVDGQLGTSSKMLPGAAKDLKSKINDPAYKAQVQQGFAADAWLGNWDTVGLNHDNIVTHDGKPVRVDPGGALLYRAQGEAKGDKFGPTVPEWSSLRSISTNPQTASVFGDMTPEQMKESARKVLAVSPAQIDAAVNKAGFDKATADKLKNTLKARREDIAKKAGLTLPENAKSKPYAPTPANAPKPEPTVNKTSFTPELAPKTQVTTHKSVPEAVDVAQKQAKATGKTHYVTDFAGSPKVSSQPSPDGFHATVTPDGKVTYPKPEDDPSAPKATTGTQFGKLGHEAAKAHAQEMADSTGKPHYVAGTPTGYEVTQHTTKTGAQVFHPSAPKAAKPGGSVLGDQLGMKMNPHANANAGQSSATAKLVQSSEVPKGSVADGLAKAAQTGQPHFQGSHGSPITTVQPPNSSSYDVFMPDGTLWIHSANWSELDQVSPGSVDKLVAHDVKNAASTAKSAAAASPAVNLADLPTVKLTSKGKNGTKAQKPVLQAPVGTHKVGDTVVANHHATGVPTEYTVTKVGTKSWTPKGFTHEHQYHYLEPTGNPVKGTETATPNAPAVPKATAPKATRPKAAEPAAPTVPETTQVTLPKYLTSWKAGTANSAPEKRAQVVADLKAAPTIPHTLNTTDGPQNISAGIQKAATTGKVQYWTPSKGLVEKRPGKAVTYTEFRPDGTAWQHGQGSTKLTQASDHAVAEAVGKHLGKDYSQVTAASPKRSAVPHADTQAKPEAQAAANTAAVADPQAIPESSYMDINHNFKFTPLSTVHSSNDLPKEVPASQLEDLPSSKKGLAKVYETNVGGKVLKAPVGTYQVGDTVPVRTPDNKIQHWTVTKGSSKSYVPEGRTVEHTYFHVAPHVAPTPAYAPVAKADKGEIWSEKKVSQYLATHGPKLAGSEAQAITSYTGSKYKGVNDALRTGGSMSGSDKALVHGLDSAAEKYEAPATLEVIRKVTQNNWPAENLAGQVYVEHAFGSSSFSDKVWAGNTWMHITVPKGSHGIPVISTKKGANDQEHEFILPRESHYLVHKDEMVNGVRHVYMTMVPSDEEVHGEGEGKKLISGAGQFSDVTTNSAYSPQALAYLVKHGAAAYRKRYNVTPQPKKTVQTVGLSSGRRKRALLMANDQNPPLTQAEKDWQAKNWTDDMTKAPPPTFYKADKVAHSPEAMKILTEQGVDAYKKYLADKRQS